MVAADRIRAVVFDLDDTLYPEFDFVRSGFRAVATAFPAELGSHDAAFERLWQTFMTGDRRRVFDNVLSAGAARHSEPTAERVGSPLGATADQQLVVRM